MTVYNMLRIPTSNVSTARPLRSFGVVKARQSFLLGADEELQNVTTTQPFRNDQGHHSSGVVRPTSSSWLAADERTQGTATTPKFRSGEANQ
jgi:hypothetical protein